MRRLALLISILAVSSALAKSPASTAAPQSFSAFIGGFTGPSCRVELQDRKLLYTTFHGDPNRGKTETIEPTPAQWKKFRAALDAIPLWTWKPDYTDRLISDGTQWKIAIVYADRSLTTHGSNAYPDESGNRAQGSGYSAPFNAWRTALEGLLGGKTFR